MNNDDSTIDPYELLTDWLKENNLYDEFMAADGDRVYEIVDHYGRSFD